LANSNFFIARNGLAVGNSTFLTPIVDGNGKWLGSPSDYELFIGSTANTASANTIYIQGVDLTQNTNISNLTSWLSSNVAYITGVDLYQNTQISAVNSYAESAYNYANTSVAYIDAVDITQNTWITSNVSYFQGIENTQNTNINNLTTWLSSNIAYIAGVDVSQNTEITAVNNYAASAYGFANSTYSTLISDVNYIAGIDATQNTEISAVNNYAVGAYNTANTALSNSIYNAGVDLTQNTNITSVNNYAAGAYSLANTTASLLTSDVNYIAGVDATQNTEIFAVNNYAASAYNYANTSVAYIFGVDLTQNTNITAVNNYAASAYNLANSNYNLIVSDVNYIAGVDATQNTEIFAVNNYAAGAYSLANTTASLLTSDVNYIAGVDAYQNTQISAVNSYAASAYNYANTSVQYISGVDAYQNTYMIAVNNYAASAYNKANNDLPLTGGTLTGPLTISNGIGTSLTTSGNIIVGTDLNVSGNLNITGNVNTIGTNNLQVSDSIIYLAANNTSNIFDIGIVGHFTGGTYNNYQHTGFVRNHLSGVWGLFSNVSTEPSSTINWAEANLVFDVVQTGGVITPVINSTGSLTLETVGTPRVVIDTLGNVTDTGNYYLTGTYFDNQNTGYYVKPSGNTNLNTLYTSGQLTIDGFTNHAGLSFRNGFGPANVGIQAKPITTANYDGIEILGYNGIDLTINNGSTVAVRVTGQNYTYPGYVGIGTTTPSSLLEIYGPSARFYITDGTSSLAFGLWDGVNNRIESANRPLFLTSYTTGIYLGYAGAQQAYFDSSANFYLTGTYYDWQNTSYYVKPSGTSNLSALNVGGFATVTTGNIGSYAVTSFSTGTTGLTPSTSTSGAVTLAGTLAVSNGGTGATTLTGYVYGNGTGAFTASTTIPNTSITGLGTMSTQNANSVAITGGSIDGTSIGQTTASLLTGTTVTATSQFNGPGTGLTGTASGLSIGGNSATTSQTNFTNLTIGGSQVLDAANYNSYAPTLTGGGASGTWNINISGNSQGMGSEHYYDQPSGPLSYTLQSNGSGSGFYMVQFASNIITFGAVVSNGNLNVGGTYYDNANTGYYVKPSGTSNLNVLDLQGTLTTKTPVVASSLSTANYGVIEIPNPNPANSGTNYIVGYHQISTLSGYGYQQHLSIGQKRVAGDAWGDAFIGVGGNDSYPTVEFLFRYTGDFYVPSSSFISGTMYDGANTGYYVKPSGLSNLASLNVGGSAVVTNNGGNYNIAVAHLLINGTTWDSNWNWSGQGGQPTWLWGSNDGVNMYVWNPSNFSVNYANSAGSAGSINSGGGLQNMTVNNIGSYQLAGYVNNTGTHNWNDSISGGSISTQYNAFWVQGYNTGYYAYNDTSLPGTWRWLGGSGALSFVRIA